MQDTLPDLDDLQNQLDEAERELASQKWQRDSLKDDIASVQKTKTALDQSGEAYGKALDGLKSLKKELSEYYKLKSGMVESAVQKKKEQLDAVINEYDDGTELQRRKVQELVDQEREAAKDYDKATATLNLKTHTFDEYKNYKMNVEQKLTAIRTQKKIEKEDDARNLASMYFLLSEMKKSLEGVKLHSAEELQKIARDRWRDLYEANKDARDKKAVLDEKKAELQKERTALEKLQQERFDNILADLAQFNESSGAGPPTATSKKTTSKKTMSARA